MSPILQNLREQNPFKRVFSRLFPSSFVHPRFRLFIIFLVSHLPFILVLVAGVHAEEHIHDKDSLLTRCSPAAESAWMFFTAICGLLATVVDFYCIDQLTSTPEQRSKRNWPKWSRRRNRSGNPSFSSSCDSVVIASGEAFELVSVDSRTRLAPATGRVSAFHEHIDDEPLELANPNASARVVPVVRPAGGSRGRTGSEPLTPADGFSPNPGPEQPGSPPTYREATLMPIRNTRPTIVNIRRDPNPRPPLIRREAANPIPTQSLLESHQGGPPSWSRKSGKFNIVWKVCLSVSFILCFIPLILSCSIQPLVRDSIYAHACDGYEWEVILDARNGLKKSSPSSPSPSSLPTAKFIDRKIVDPGGVAKSFTMEMSLDSAPQERSIKSKIPADPRKPSLKYRRDTITPVKEKFTPLRAPRRKEQTYYDRFFHLKYSHKSLTQHLLSLVSYDTITHTYRGTPVNSKSTRLPLGIAGEYTGNEHMEFPELGLRQVAGEPEDYFGFPRIVLEKDSGGSWGEEVLVTSRVKRRSCAEMKVCVKGVKVTEAAVAVGPLLLGVVEAAGECKKGRR